MGGAQPLAAVFAGASCLAVECNPRVDRVPAADALSRREGGDARRGAGDDRGAGRRRARRSRSGCVGNAADVFPELVRRGVRPDIVTDQTSAHDPVNGYLPQGWTMAEWRARRESDPKAVERAARASMKVHVAAMVDFWNAGRADARLRQQHPADGEGGGAGERLRLPGVRAGLHPAAVLPRGSGRSAGARCRATPRTSTRTDAKVKELIPDDAHLHPGSTWRASGSPSRGCRRGSAGSGSGSGTGSGSRSTRWCATGELKAPVVIGRDHLDSGSVASPNRETEAMADGSDAVSDWPLLNALLNCASGRDLGVAAPRRRRGHGVLASTRAW